MKDSSKSIKNQSKHFCLFVYQVDTPVNVVLKVKEALKLMTFKRVRVKDFHSDSKACEINHVVVKS